MTPEEFLRKTESAARRLFDAVQEYLRVLHDAPLPPTFNAIIPIGTEPAESEYRAWFERTAGPREARRKAEEVFVAETAAQSVICGAVLQLACTGVRLSGTEHPDSFPQWFPEGSRNPDLSRFCSGRLVHGVPLGLVVYAGRNQHAHFAEGGSLHKATAAVLEQVQTFWSRPAGLEFSDPAFDPSQHPEASLAHNITALLGWRSYPQYLADMRALLCQS